MRIVVIGATGNVGTSVLRRLHRVPELEVTGIARRVPTASKHPYEGVDWNAIDIGADDAAPRLTEVFRGADAVIHLAWALQPNRDEAAMMRTNVRGLRNVILAAVDAGIPQLAVASSVGAYSPGPKHREVDETWPTDGVQSSQYARQKAANERMLDALEQQAPDMIVTRLRPGLVMHGIAGGEIARLFLGRLVPTGWLTKVRLPFLPLPATMVSQVIHESDLAEAFWLAVEKRAGGAFNIAADPVVSPELAAGVLRTRWTPLPQSVLRAIVAVSWRLRLQETDPGWIDLAESIPVMSTERARTELGWLPKVGAEAAMTELVEGLAGRRVHPASPALQG